MNYKITTLVENCVYGRKLQAEHGLSLYIETAEHKLLFDTGASDLFISNARLLHIDLREVDYLILFRCKSRNGRIREHREKIKTAKVMSEIRAIESNKHPVYTFQGKDKTLELPMEITDKGKLVSVIVNGSKTCFQLSDEDSEFTVSPQGVLAWHEAGVLTTEEIGGEETIRQLKENTVNDSLTVHLFNIRIGNCVLPEVNVRITQTQEFPYLMGIKAWNMLLLSLASDKE